MVLHHVSDDSKLVKVTTTALSTEGFLESDGDAGNVVSAPGGTKDHVSKSQADQVLHHLLAKVVINPVQLVLREQLLQVVTEVRGAGRVLTEGFLYNDPGPSRLRHAGGLATGMITTLNMLIWPAGCSHAIHYGYSTITMLR